MAYETTINENIKPAIKFKLSSEEERANPNNNLKWGLGLQFKWFLNKLNIR